MCNHTCLFLNDPMSRTTYKAEYSELDFPRRLAKIRAIQAENNQKWLAAKGSHGSEPTLPDAKPPGESANERKQVERNSQVADLNSASANLLYNELEAIQPHGDKVSYYGPRMATLIDAITAQQQELLDEIKEQHGEKAVQVLQQAMPPVERLAESINALSQRLGYNSAADEASTQSVLALAQGADITDSISVNRSGMPVNRSLQRARADNQAAASAASPMGSSSAAGYSGSFGGFGGVSPIAPASPDSSLTSYGADADAERVLFEDPLSSYAIDSSAYDDLLNPPPYADTSVSGQATPTPAASGQAASATNQSVLSGSATEPLNTSVDTSQNLRPSDVRRDKNLRGPKAAQLAAAQAALSSSAPTSGLTFSERKTKPSRQSAPARQATDSDLSTTSALDTTTGSSPAPTADELLQRQYQLSPLNAPNGPSASASSAQAATAATASPGPASSAATPMASSSALSETEDKFVRQWRIFFRGRPFDVLENADIATGQQNPGDKALYLKAPVGKANALKKQLFELRKAQIAQDSGRPKPNWDPSLAEFHPLFDTIYAAKSGQGRARHGGRRAGPYTSIHRPVYSEEPYNPGPPPDGREGWKPPKEDNRHWGGRRRVRMPVHDLEVMADAPPAPMVPTPSRAIVPYVPPIAQPSVEPKSDVPAAVDPYQVMVAFRKQLAGGRRRGKQTQAAEERREPSMPVESTRPLPMVPPQPAATPLPTRPVVEEVPTRPPQESFSGPPRPPTVVEPVAREPEPPREPPARPAPVPVDPDDLPFEQDPPTNYNRQPKGEWAGKGVFGGGEWHKEFFPPMPINPSVKLTGATVGDVKALVSTIKSIAEDLKAVADANITGGNGDQRPRGLSDFIEKCEKAAANGYYPKYMLMRLYEQPPDLRPMMLDYARLFHVDLAMPSSEGKGRRRLTQKQIGNLNPDMVPWTPEKVLDRVDLLSGMIEEGNNNPELAEELESWIPYCVEHRLMTPKKAQKIYHRLNS